MRPREKYPLNQESRRIVGKNGCDLKGKYPLNRKSRRIVGKNGCDLKRKYLLNRKSRRIVGKNGCAPRKKYPLYQERWNLVGKFRFVEQLSSSFIDPFIICSHFRRTLYFSVLNPKSANIEKYSIAFGDEMRYIFR